jgi:soluble lytic murein transglycosylase-like protein
MCCLSIATPALTYDPVVEVSKYKPYYKWLTPRIFIAIYNNSKKFDLKIDYILGLIKEESHGSPSAISHSNARGLMQVIGKYHYKKGNVNDLHNIELNVYLGCKYFKQQLNSTKGDLKEALRYYNAGPKSDRASYKNWNNYVYPIIKHSKYTSKLKSNWMVIR